MSKKPTAYNYSALGLQIVGMIGIGALAGNYLDERFQTSKQWFTLGLIILCTGVSMWYTIRTLNKWN